MPEDAPPSYASRDLRCACTIDVGLTPKAHQRFHLTVLPAAREDSADEALEAVRRHPAIDAMNWTCAVPTCTNRANLEAHHVKYRSRGGATAADNLVPLCSAHHHHGEHEGRLHVWGKAPDQLVWALGIREDEPPHLRVEGRRVVGGSARPECRQGGQGERWAEAS